MSKEADELGLAATTEKVELDHGAEPLSERDLQLLKLEQELNQKLDTELEKGGDNLLWPRALWFIIPNEFGERFNYYGVRPLFAKYLTTMVGVTSAQGAIYVSYFNAMAYVFPLGGAALSDSFLGKYWTIVSLSVVYALGVILLAIFSIPGLLGYTGLNEKGLELLPLVSWFVPVVLIAIGTGGIKPCVSAHGGDQYLTHQRKGMDFFFSIFYISINIGALISGSITPLWVQNTTCFGRPCYFQPYIMCACVFTVAALIFAFGKPFYRIVPPRGQFLPWLAVKTALIAGYKYIKAPSAERKAKKHYLEFATEEMGADLVEETKLLGNVIYAILPIMFFWMVYDQGSNEWYYQYDLMTPASGLPAETFSNINSLLIIILVPSLVPLYRWLESKQIRLSILGRMTIGFSLMCISFLVSAILQIQVIEGFDPTDLDDKGYCKSKCVSAWWQLPQWFLLSLGEAMLSPEGLKFTYMNVGKQMRAQSLSFWLLMSSLGNIITAQVGVGIEKNSMFNDYDSLKAKSNVDNGISLPAKYFLFTGLAIIANIWFWAWGLFVFEFKDQNSTMTGLEGWRDRRRRTEHPEVEATIEVAEVSSGDEKKVETTI
ncbi:POT family-domain-containing protein [Cladochytrium replicatum]|nr:POT family-domain-containing protein [Cladochytrium replicatum]